MYNFLLEHILLPLGDLINGSSYIKQLKLWRKIDTYSERDLNALQIKNLQAVLQEALQNVPYYKNLEVSSEKEVNLNDFPIIDKNIIRTEVDQLISNRYQKKKLIPYSSSGSTGTQTTVYMTKQEQSVLRGILTHWWEWSGYKIGKPIVQTGITPQRGFLKTIKDKLFRTIYINAFSHTHDQLKNVCEKVQRSSNFFFAGYASSLNVIAEYAIENKYNITSKGVISLGDKLFDHYKKNIKKAFKAKTYDTYGSNEGFMIAAQDDLDYYYMLSPHVFVEIVDDDNQPIKDGEIGHIVVTRLDCFSMPLIRYKIGDLGVKLPIDEYPIKRKYNYPLLKKVVGRETDIVLLPDATKLVVHSFTGIFEYIKEIKQFKVIQNDKSGIIIEYIKSSTFEETALKRAEKELRNYIKDNKFSIIFKEVSSIASSKSGKPQIIESRLKNE
ncbi:hypothetical protein AAON49_06985 [Pseudotenacibaculum sp. MALMAid0570]|uniref:hypothetical protein n=1 Tax=Pseudotenacibaculum sp. MALMAid0570 TaxID=3143938 RepID=UPI0032DF1FA8